jgi:hypothetical protein
MSATAIVSFRPEVMSSSVVGETAKVLPLSVRPVRMFTSTFLPIETAVSMLAAGAGCVCAAAAGTRIRVVMAKRAVRERVMSWSFLLQDGSLRALGWT